ncbi:MAG: DUF2153 family protein [TACK group archaeon]|nr:DUF2153 family protein [TACK group archaeon]
MSSWEDRLIKKMDMVKKMNYGDRLSLYNDVRVINLAMMESVNGWNQWLSDPSIIDTFTEEELRELFDGFRRVALEFMEMDLKWTSKKSRMGQEGGDQSPFGGR